MKTKMATVLGIAMLLSSCQQTGKVGSDGFATVNYSEETRRGQISEALQLQFSMVEESARPISKLLRVILESMEGTKITIDEKTKLFIVNDQLVGIAENLHLLSGTPIKLEGNKFRLRSKGPIKGSLIISEDNKAAEVRIDGEVNNKGEIINYDVQVIVNDASYNIASYTVEDDLVFSSKQVEKLISEQFLGGKTIFKGMMEEEGIVYKVDIKNKNAYLIKFADFGALEYQIFDSPYTLVVDHMKLVITRGKLSSLKQNSKIEGRIINVETPSADPLVSFDDDGFEISYNQITEDDEIHFFTKKQWDEL